MIELKLDEKELEALYAVLDAGVKELGLQYVPFVAHIMGKIEEAKKGGS